MSALPWLSKQPPDKIRRICATITEAGMIRQTGGDWQAAIRRAASRRVGFERRLYAQLLNEGTLERAEKAICED